MYDCLIHHQILGKEYIRGPLVSLKLQGFYDDEIPSDLPHYCFFIMLGTHQIGTITLRLGFNEMTRVHGHIGYSISASYRGYGYSYYALELILDLAKEHGYDHLLLTCDPDNLSSIKSVLKAGGKLTQENIEIPKDHIYYVLGLTHLNHYEIKLR